MASNSLFNRLGEIAGEYLKRGSKVYVEGELRTREWEKEGQKHFTTEIVANEMQMLDSKGGNSDYETSNSSSSGAPSSLSSSDIIDDDIPLDVKIYRSIYRLWR